MATGELYLDEAPLDKESRVRTSIFNENMNLARIIARSYYAKRICSDVEYQDYLHYAFAGLLESIDRYDPNEKASFSTFASYRIRGSILNGIEKFSEHREQIAFRKRLRQERVQSLGVSVRSSSRDSLFEEMVELTLDIAIGFMLEGAVITQQGSAAEVDLPQQKYVANKNKEGLLNRVESLPESERMVIHFHYFYHTSFVDIAKVLNLSKGRISQIHNSGIKRLRSFFNDGDTLDHYL